MSDDCVCKGGDSAARQPVIVLDEIGKMELFSSTFEHQVRQLMSRQDLTVLATIPEKRATPIRLADEIRESATVSLWKVRMHTDAVFRLM